MKSSNSFRFGLTFWCHFSCLIVSLKCKFIFETVSCTYIGTYFCVLLLALSDRGLQLSNVTHVVCSHGHSDHVGNLGLFPDALLIVSYDICRGDTYYSGLTKVSVWCIFFVIIHNKNILLYSHLDPHVLETELYLHSNSWKGTVKASGVLLNMEVGIRKRAWHTCIQYTLLIYDHWGEYML